MSDAGSSTQKPPEALQAPTDRSQRPRIVGPEEGPGKPFPIYLSGTVQRGFGRGGKDLGCPTANLPSKVLSQEGGLIDAPTGVYFGYARILGEEEGGRGEEYEDKEQKDKAVGSKSDESGVKSTSGNLTEQDFKVYPMVMSLGWNPFYANKTKTAVRAVRCWLRESVSRVLTDTCHRLAQQEVHIMHPFKADFYGLHIKTIVLGYIRPEYNYVNVGECCAPRVEAGQQRRRVLIRTFDPQHTTDALIEDIETDKEVAHKSLERKGYSVFETDPFFAAKSSSSSSL